MKHDYNQTCTCLSQVSHKEYLSLSVTLKVYFFQEQPLTRICIPLLADIYIPPRDPGRGLR